MMLITTLRDEEFSTLYFKIKFKRYDNFFCGAIKAFTYLWNGLIQQLFIGFIEFSFVFISKALIDCTISYMDIINKRILSCIIAYNSENINICNCMTYDFALCCEVIKG